jgi:xanthine dehydrogenase small subunit
VVSGVSDGTVSLPSDHATVEFQVDDRAVTVPDDGASLLEALRDRLGVRSAKDGCSPQGQCGCCTVLVDGQPRVACVTPVARVRGRSVTTIDGLDPAVRDAWADAFAETGGSQCGFCTPGIIVRLAAHAASGPLDQAGIDKALLAHLCRCTGWQTIREAAALATRDLDHAGTSSARETVTSLATPARRDAASRRARIEGGSDQIVAPEVALGRGGFSDDIAPLDALVAVLDAQGEWVVADTLSAARRATAKVQGRRTTAPLSWPIELPEGDWVRTLQTTWVEPAYLEPDAVWCAPGGDPVGPLGNGGAFGGKIDDAEVLRSDARRLADQHGRAVRLLLAREDVVRRGVKRPPMAAGIRADGSGIIRIARTAGVVDAIASVMPDVAIEEVDVVGPATSRWIRGAGWVEAAILMSSLRDAATDVVRSPEGAEASAWLDEHGDVHVEVSCGEVLDAVVLRSYCIGAAHMALGWVRTEGMAVDELGTVGDLTIRSFGVLRAVDTPPIHVVVDHSATGPAVNGSDAVFAAVAAAAWRHEASGGSWPDRWPTRR